MTKPAPKVILIGGSSHSGKSTAAMALAARPGWRAVSTDSMARHPGRPWAVPTPEGPRPVKPHVAEHYRRLSVDVLISDVRAHYKRMWPDIEKLITAQLDFGGSEGLILEGSALWPDEVAGLAHEGIAAVWLTAPDALFKERIKSGSAYGDADPGARALIDKFIARTLRYNDEMMQAVARHGLVSLDVTQPGFESLPDRILDVGPLH